MNDKFKQLLAGKTVQEYAPLGSVVMSLRSRDPAERTGHVTGYTEDSPAQVIVEWDDGRTTTVPWDHLAVFV